MKVAVACDHTGIELKTILLGHLTKKGVEIVDFTHNINNSIDYPDYALPVAEAVAAGKADYGILICGTGIGMSICANKVKGIRCALCNDNFSAEATRQHNNSNVLALGARVISQELAVEIADTFLFTDYSGEERHERRLNKLTAIEQKYFK